MLLDATTAEAAAENARTALTHGIPPVIAHGLSPAAIETIEQLCAERGLGAAIVPNFALGAAVLLHLARVAAQHFDWAEIIELHHEKKPTLPQVRHSISPARWLSGAAETSSAPIRPSHA